MLRLAFPLFVGIVLATRPLARAGLPLQEEGEPNAPHSDEAPAQEPPLAINDEAREALELLHSVLKEEGPEHARELLHEIVAGLADAEPGGEMAHIAYLLELVGLAKQLGGLAESQRLCERVLAIRSRLLPADHPDVIKAKVNLAVTRKALGDLAGARELEEAVVDGWTHLLPAGDPALLMAKQNLANTRAALGDLAGARELEESVLETRSRLLPPDDPDLLSGKLNLAITRYELGDLAGAQELCEAVLDARTRLLERDAPDLLVAKQNLAGIRLALGDFGGAEELLEPVVEAWMRLLPADHPSLIGAKQGLAVARKERGDFAGAKALEEDVLATRTRLFSPDHPGVLAAKQNLALTRKALGDFDGAKELEVAVLDARARLLPSGHPDLLAAQTNLGATLYESGDFTGAQELFQVVFDVRKHLLSVDHPDLLLATENLALSREALGDAAGARTLVSCLLSGVRLRAGALCAQAPRAARECARVDIQRLTRALALGASADPEHTLEPEYFATLESLRHASVASAEAAHALAGRPDLIEEARAVAAVRSEINNLVAAGPEDARTADSWRAELVRLTEERDRSERRLRKTLEEGGAFAGKIDASAVGTSLPSCAAAVSFLRYSRRFEKDAETGTAPAPLESLLAFVVRSDGSVQRIELGAAAEVEDLVKEWRSALGCPLGARGIGASRPKTYATDLDTLGRRLRERVLDPVVAAAGNARTLYLVPDDILYLVPLDALPLEDGTVGDRIALRSEVTLAHLVMPALEVSPEGGMLIAGGVDYDAELSFAGTVFFDGATRPGVSGPRSGTTTPEFIALPAARSEAESISTLYKEVFGHEASLLVQGEATKSALHASAPTVRYLHVATHGWFADEKLRSQLDSVPESDSRDAFQRAEATLTGFAPETLCGLALAGANRGKDALGRVPGILTAEELASFDLRNCELAVLSACETNVGIRRAGQGIQSLQTALHAAGARTAITSLWKVDDAATRRLFELFYTKLWKEKLGKADALWQAKMALRAEGHPLRDWAGWVLSGDPE